MALTFITNMAEIEVSTRAYSKLFLHASKYPHCSVNGILLAEKPKTKEPKTLKFVDCIPLFHLSLSLAPMLEVALTQVDSHCKSKGLVIAGYYQANDYYRDPNPNVAAFRIGDKIRDHFPDTCIFMVDNKKMLADCPDAVFRIYNNQDGKWKQIENIKPRDTLEVNTLEATSMLFQSKGHSILMDFDNHLDDITKDWRNTEINSQLEHVL